MVMKLGCGPDLLQFFWLCALATYWLCLQNGSKTSPTAKGEPSLICVLLI